jgi:hypothetical protein
MAGQKLKGFIRGIKGIEFIPYTGAGVTLALDPTKKFYVPYTQNATQEIDLLAGDKGQFTGSGKIALVVKDPDQILGVTLGFSSTRVDLELGVKLIGGKVLYDVPGDATSAIKTWNPPVDPNAIPGLFMSVYSQNYESDNNGFGFLVTSYPFVKCGYPKLPEQTEKDYLRFDLNAYGTRNPLYVDEATTPLLMPGPMFYDFVSALPAGLL